MTNLSTPEQIRERMGIKPLGAVYVDPDNGSSLYGRSAQRGLDPDLMGMVGKPYSKPRLKRDGAPFKPGNAVGGVPVGAMLSWTEMRRVLVDSIERTESVKRSGQVWSGHWKPRVVWVAPSDGGSAVAVDTKTMEVFR